MFFSNHRASTSRGFHPNARVRHSSSLFSRLLLEQLEDRSLPATITWIGNEPGAYWSDPENWSSDRVPNSSDNVFISDLNCNLDVSASVGDLTLSDVILSLNSYRLTATHLTWSAGASGNGTISGNSGSGILDIEGTGGTIGGPMSLLGATLINADGVMSFSGDSDNLGMADGAQLINSSTSNFIVENNHLISGDGSVTIDNEGNFQISGQDGLNQLTFLNYGSVQLGGQLTLDAAAFDNLDGVTSYSSSGDSDNLSLKDGSQFVNSSTSSFIVENNHSIFGDGSSTFDNEGDLEFSGQDSLVNLTFDNNGTLQLNDGSLSMQSITGDGSGSIEANSNTSIEFMNVAYTLDDGASLLGAGQFRQVDDSIITIDGSIAVQSYWLDGGTLQGLSGGGIISIGNGTFIWDMGTISGCTLDIGQTGTLDIENNSSNQDPLVLDSSIIDNFGTTNWTANLDIDAQNGSVFINEATGLFVVTSSQTFDSSTSGDPGNFVNEGQFVVMGGSTVATQITTTFNTAFANSGLMEIEVAKVDFAGGFTQTQGATLLIDSEMNATDVELEGGC
jgi:hypothetical protein